MIDWKSAALYGIAGAVAGGLLSTLLPKSAAAAPEPDGPSPPSPTPGTRQVTGQPPGPAPVVYPTGGVIAGLVNPDSSPAERSSIIYDAVVNRGIYDKPPFRMIYVGQLDSSGKVLVDDAHDFGTIAVSADAMKIDGVRYNVTYPVHALIGRALGFSMLTMYVADLMWLAAGVQLTFQAKSAWQQDGTMGKSSRMAQYSQILDGLLAGRTLADAQGPLIIGNLGKDWMLTKMGFSPGNTPPSPPNAAVQCQVMPYADTAPNYGWYGGQSHSIVTALRVVQPIGYCHDRGHSDYSQLSRYMGRTMWVHRAGTPVDQGTWMPVADVLAGPLAHILTGPEGTIPDDFPPNVQGPGGVVA